MSELGEGCVTELGDMSNDELLARLRAHVGRGNIWLARLLAYLGELDARRLYAEKACTSTWDFCVRKLGMSESEAQRRIAVARLVRSCPLAGGYLERGEVHLCALYELHKHLTADNHEELLREAVGKTTKAVAEMLAARFPRPDVHGCIEPLAPQPALAVASTEMLPPSEAELSAPPPPMTRPPPPTTTQVRPRVEPLSASRYRVEFTVSAETKAKLERIQALMRHRNPSGDLEKIFEASVDLLVTKLEKERLGKTTRSKDKTPSTTTDANGGTSRAEQHASKPARRGRVARAVQREVWARDAGRCTYVDAEGHRCPARGFLELDHIDAKALGGSDEATNLRLRCRVHNRLHAENVFGRAFIEERIYLRQRKPAAPAEASRNPSAPAQSAPARGQRNETAPADGARKETALAEGQRKATAPALAQRKETAPAEGQRNQSPRALAPRNQPPLAQAQRNQSASAEAQRKQAAPAQAQRKESAPAQALSFETAARGLRTLGFRESEVREVIARLATSLDPDTSVERIVRDALGLLT